MNPKITANRFRFVFALVLCALGATTAALGQSGSADRAGRWEFSLLAQYWTANDITLQDVTLPNPPIGNIPTATSDLNYALDDEFFWGLGLAYNISDRFAVRSEFTFGNPSYEMTWNNSRITGKAYVHTGKVNLDVNLTTGDGPFTPFISAGVGYHYLDTGVPSGPPEFYYWWDYWWNVPVVAVSVPTFSETTFAYNATAGVRWDISPTAVVKLTVTQNWVDQSNRGGTLETLDTTLSFAWKW
jgi:opacity protein-like surface antigen